MSFVIGGNSASTGYNLTRSLRFRASATASLTRTPATTGTRKTWTWSCWVKRGLLGVAAGQEIFDSANGAGSVRCFFRFINASEGLYFQWNAATSSISTTAVFRDPSSWYHIILAGDSTQATASNRLKLYVNGVQITAGTFNYPALNEDSELNIGSQPFSIAKYSNGGEYFDGYMTEINFVDGQQLTPSSFGSTNSLTGVWQPAAYTGSYGTNGFILDFEDNSALTTSSNVGLGKDTSGNGNYWTTNNISITAGVTYDSMTDVPTLTSATASNFCVVNPLQKSTNATITNGNLSYSGGAASQQSLCTIGVTSGKWYWEDTKISGTYGFAGLAQANASLNTFAGNDAYSWGYNVNGNKYNNGVATAYGATWTSGDVIGVAFDATAGSLTFYKNNVSQGVAFTGLTSGPYFASCCDFSTVGAINFGQQPFTYTPPTGYVALNTYNLPTSTIVKGNTVMDATLYTGDGTSPRTITNAAAFQPDFVWIKKRSAAEGHILNNSVMGVGTGVSLYSNQTVAAGTFDQYGYLNAFNSNGFSTQSGSTSSILVNENAATYVAWQWQAGQGSSSSNTNGNVTSTVSVNASAGFSVVTYTVTSTASMTIGHGLGVAPQLIIEKGRTTVSNWDVYTAATGNTGRLLLNSTSAFDVQAGVWNNTTPTSTVFSQQGNGTWHAVGVNCVAYCWTPIAGFSAFGSYTGNGSADGPFVYTGFRPKFVMMKRTDAVGDWWIFDTARDTYNVMTQGLYADTSGAEANNGATVDYLSNGFKLRIATYQPNTSGATFVYMAFAETPFKNSLGR